MNAKLARLSRGTNEEIYLREIKSHSAVRKEYTIKGTTGHNIQF